MILLNIFPRKNRDADIENRHVDTEGEGVRNWEIKADIYTVMEPMQGKLSSSQIDFGYTEQFCIPGVTSVFFSSCDSVVGDSLEFNQANRGSLRV